MDLPIRKRTRLEQYDYSQLGYYFVTLCTHEKMPLFWENSTVGAGSKPARVPLNAFGKIVWDTWLDLPAHNPNLSLDAFVVMPNHIHGIFVLNPTRAGLEPAPTERIGVSEIVRQLKTFSAQKINFLRGTPGAHIWQRSFYDHIIRDEADYLRIWQYIDTNPVKWREDCYYEG